MLLGHLIGDFIFQRDWEARLKVAQPPKTPRPEPPTNMWVSIEQSKAVCDWDNDVRDAKLAPWACTWHCASYTAAIFMMCFWFLPWWAYPVIFITHWPVDRWRLARRFMLLNGQARFATEGLAPWSVILVDNICHLSVLYVLGLLAVV